MLKFDPDLDDGLNDEDSVWDTFQDPLLLQIMSWIIFCHNESLVKFSYLHVLGHQKCHELGVNHHNQCLAILRLLLFLFHGDVLEAEHTLLCLYVIPAQLLPFPPLVVGSIQEQTSTGTEKLSQGLCSNRSKDNW